MALSRRALLAAGTLVPVVGVAGAGILDAPPAAAVPTQPPIRPRADWAGKLKPKGPLEVEEDVRFLLVHHTLTPNTDTGDRIPARLRSVFGFHTSAQRGWHDVAYNFFVDPAGTIWEGREGSIDRPMKGDATGGSQGFALLCCFLGDFTSEVPTPEAMASMTQLLAWLAAREGLNLADPVSFTSRGSSKWRKGAEVMTEQVAGHRDMSATACPGDALYPLVRSQLLPGALALLSPPIPTSEPSPTPSPQPAASAEPSASTPAPEGQESLPPWVGGAAVAAGVAALAAGAVIGRRRRGSGSHQLRDDDRTADREGAEEAEEEPDEGA